MSFMGFMMAGSGFDGEGTGEKEKEKEMEVQKEMETIHSYPDRIGLYQTTQPNTPTPLRR